MILRRVWLARGLRPKARLLGIAFEGFGLRL